ncbi:MAG: hypothetical protein J5792_08330 [Bacteroidales bacterium]|nr:hypothetical protein [Bacteroidales bacterium]
MSGRCKEIGSEFWFGDSPKPVSERDGCYVLSGRTAIDLIVQDILKYRKICNVYMPAWCCSSMMAPFICRGVRVDLYDVGFDGRLRYYVDEGKEADIFYVANYFGFDNTIGPDIVRRFIRKGAVVIYDRTHSFLMDEDIGPHYSFASIRKWMGVMCGAVVDGVSDVALGQCPYLSVKERAMRMKRAFMEGDDSICKKDFLDLYGDFGRLLTEDYRDYAMDDVSYGIYKAANIRTMKGRRRENAMFLDEHLEFPCLGPVGEKDVPLFFPVFFESIEKREAAREKLIANGIYCPIHWPKNPVVTPEMEVNRIFDTELSLVCDQRYGVAEMQRIIDILIQ